MYDVHEDVPIINKDKWVLFYHYNRKVCLALNQPDSGERHHITLHCTSDDTPSTYLLANIDNSQYYINKVQAIHWWSCLFTDHKKLSQ